MNISRIINFFFEKKNIFQYIEETYENNLEELFKPTIEALKSNIEEWNQKPEVVENLEAIKIKNTSVDTIINVYQLLQDFLRFRNSKELILEFMDISLHNIETIIINIPLIDKAIYSSLSKLISIIHSKDNLKIKDLISEFGRDFFSGINFITIVQSILFFHEKKDFEEIKNTMNIYEYEKYISDWTLKYAQILEGPLKNALFFLLKLDYIRREKNYNKLDIKWFSLGQLLSTLNVYPNLANYRNAIYHQNVILTNTHEIHDKYITFYDREKEFVLSIDDFINEFYKVVIFLFSFYLLMLKSYLEFYHQPEQIINKILLESKEMIEILFSKSYNDFILHFQSIFKEE